MLPQGSNVLRQVVVKPEIRVECIFQEPIKLGKVVDEAFKTPVFRLYLEIRDFVVFGVKHVWNHICDVSDVRNAHVLDNVPIGGVVSVAKVQPALDD